MREFNLSGGITATAYGKQAESILLDVISAARSDHGRQERFQQWLKLTVARLRRFREKVPGFYAANALTCPRIRPGGSFEIPA